MLIHSFSNLPFNKTVMLKLRVFKQFFKHLISNDVAKKTVLFIQMFKSMLF